jgi:hypothetical protein
MISLKDGKLSIEQVPEIYREEVKTKVEVSQ